MISYFYQERLCIHFFGRRVVATLYPLLAAISRDMSGFVYSYWGRLSGFGRNGGNIGYTESERRGDSMIKPKMFGHIVIRVRDAQRSEDFYVNVLGLEVRNRVR